LAFIYIYIYINIREENRSSKFTINKMNTSGHCNGRLTSQQFFFAPTSALKLSELSPERSFGSCKALQLWKEKTSLRGVSINK
jgi:hypothetical protein